VAVLRPTDVTEALKRQQAEKAIELMNTSAPTFGRIPVAKEKIRGNGIYLSVNTTAPWGSTGARNVDETLPIAQRSAWQNPIITAKYRYTRVHLANQLIALAQNYKDAYVVAKANAELAAMKTFYKLQNWHVFRDAKGTLAVGSECPTATTMTMASPDYTRGLKPGMLVDIADAGTETTANVESITISTIDRPAYTVTFSDTCNTSFASGDTVVMQGDRDTTATKNICGFKSGIISSGTYFGVNVGTYEEWASNVKTFSGTPTPLTEMNMFEVLNLIEANTGSGEMNLELLCNQPVYNEYYLMHVPAARYEQGKAIKGGHTGLYFQGHELIKDTDCPADDMFFYEPTTWNKYEVQPDQWGDSGGKWQSESLSGNKDNVGSYFRSYMEVACKAPKKNGRLGDIYTSQTVK